MNYSKFKNTLTINNKRICNKQVVRFLLYIKGLRDNKKRIFCLKALQYFVIVASLFVCLSNALAYESPLQGLMDLSKTKTSGSGGSCGLSGTSDDPTQGSDDQNSQTQATENDNQSSSNVPQIVTDPNQIEKAAEFAASATGVSKDFLMGMLEVESDLGRNPGKCTYEQVEQGAQQAHSKGMLSDQSWQTFQNRQAIMKNLAQSLGYNYEQLKVSCNPTGAYAGTGGAMGVPQFMPDIWMAYKDRISSIVGKDNPDPWNIKDGAVAMALLVSDTPGVTQHNLYAERDAAKMYLSGCTSQQYDWYADQILYWSQNYSKLLS